MQSAETLPQERKNTRNNKNKVSLNLEQQRIVASAKAQFERRGGFVRIFPSPKSWELYSQYLGKHNISLIINSYRKVSRYFSKSVCPNKMIFFIHSMS